MNALLVFIGIIGAGVYLFAAVLTLKVASANQGAWVKTTPKIRTLFVIGTLLIFIAVLPAIFAGQEA